MSNGVEAPLTLEEREELVRLRVMEAEYQGWRTLMNSERDWPRCDDFWLPFITNDAGELDREKILNELCDYRAMMDNYAEVLCHVTGGRISKQNTAVSDIKCVADDVVNEIVAKEIADQASPTPSVHSGLRERLEAEMEEARADFAETHEYRTAGEVDAYERVIALIDEADKSRAASLALLQEPRVGMRVVLNTGQVWTPVFVGDKQEYGICGWGIEGSWEEGHCLYPEPAAPFLAALVKAGAAHVTVLERTQGDGA